MIGSICEDQRFDLDGFADALGGWIRGDATIASDAAGRTVARAFFRWVDLVESHFEKR